jgi:uncharacterized membrane protein YGL010W
MNDDRSPTLVSWQWSGYPDFHGNRTNLILHLISWPWFVGGFFALLTSPLAGSIAGIAIQAVSGMAAMAICMIVQGRGHKMEGHPPIPFSNGGDAFKRIFAEQLINVPRFLLTGGLARAWRATAS